MLHEVIVAFEEIFKEMGLEVTQEPVRMIAEITQFALLIGIVWVVAIGFGKRKGFVANLLSERAERTDRNLEIASRAPENLALAQKSATERIDSAETEARQLLEAAHADAEQIESTARAEADAEVSRITERAQSALTMETEEMHLELREELVSIVAQATRSILNEKMSVSEQRELIESSIAASLGSGPQPKVPDNGESHKRVRPVSRSGSAS